MTKAKESVTIYPTGDYYVPGVPAVEQTVDAETAAELLAYRPAAFTETQPTAPADPAPVPSED